MSHETDAVPEGWVREDRKGGIGGLRFDAFDGPASGWKCDNCDHYIPLDAIDGDTCPQCGRSGMIGTVVMGLQTITVLSPEGWFDETEGGDSS